jgi:PTH1 family peptidyl-tRNA hydrolase
MRVVVGLGNPGDRYRRTRHNVGFMVLDALVARAGSPPFRQQADAWVAEAQVGGEPVVFVKPSTFMNRSGVALEPVLQSRAVGPESMIVVVDDVALELGTLRVRPGGSHGGHNGLRSVIEVLETDEFARVRVGIRRGEVPGDLAEYVLGRRCHRVLD